MALIHYGVSRCTICERVIREDDDCIGACDWLPWRFAGYADAPMHRACFKAWPLGGELISAFNEVSRSWTENPCQMLEDGSLVAVEGRSPITDNTPRPKADMHGAMDGQGDLLPVLDRPDIKEATPQISAAS